MDVEVAYIWPSFSFILCSCNSCSPLIVSLHCSSPTWYQSHTCLLDSYPSPSIIFFIFPPFSLAIAAQNSLFPLHHCPNPLSWSFLKLGRLFGLANVKRFCPSHPKRAFLCRLLCCRILPNYYTIAQALLAVDGRPQDEHFESFCSPFGSETREISSKYRFSLQQPPQAKRRTISPKIH